MKHCTSQLVCWMAAIGVVVVLAGMTVGAADPRRGDPKPLVTWVEAPGDYTEVSGAVPVPVGAVASALSVRLEFIKAVATGRMAHPTWGNQYWDAGTPGNAYSHFKQQNDDEKAWQMATAMAADRIVVLADALLRAAGE